MQPRALLTQRQVAEWLGHSLDWFRRHRARLTAEQGFPAPVPGLGRRWDPAAITAWLARYRGVAPPVESGDWDNILAARACTLQHPEESPR